MKIYAYILLILFTSNVLKAGSGLSYITSALDLVESSSCCSSKTSQETCETPESKDEKDSDCCGGNSCTCTCCVHIVYFNGFLFYTAPFTDHFFTEKFNYAFLYSFDYQTPTFHPPLV